MSEPRKTIYAVVELAVPVDFPVEAIQAADVLHKLEENPSVLADVIEEPEYYTITSISKSVNGPGRLTVHAENRALKTDFVWECPIDHPLRVGDVLQTLISHIEKTSTP